MPKTKKHRVHVTRRDPYERALETATARLEKAKAERETASQRLSALNAEIPRLERIIAVLSPPKSVIRSVTYTRTDNTQLSELERFAASMPQDLTGLGSIPSTGQPQPESEDLLPEPVGKEILE